MRKMLVLGAVMVVGFVGVVFAANPREAPPVDPPKPPVVADKAAQAREVEGEAKALEKAAVIFRTSPRMVQSFDSDMAGSLTAMWNATGTHFALRGEQFIKTGVVNADGTPAFSKEPVVRLYALVGKEACQPAHPDSGASLVAVQPDGSGFVTDLREYQFISGHHQLKFWTIRPQADAAVAKTVDLELQETHDYSFSADMKTYRTVAWERGTSGTVLKLEALEVSAETGRAKKSLLKVAHGQYSMSANGKRIATLDKDATKVTIYDLDRGAKVSEAALLGEKLADRPGVMQHGGWWQQTEPTMVLSPDGKRLIVSRAIGQTVLLNTDTGEAMPVPEGVKDAGVRPFEHAFTNDGRLLAMSGTTFKPYEQTGAPFRWERVANFLAVWDTQTGKALKTWQGSPQVAFNPARPLLAIFEPNGADKTRVGFWDFAAEAEKK